jgi:F-type H+-transporting ATPase subunit delta
MAELSTLARPYAEALFDASRATTAEGRAVGAADSAAWLAAIDAIAAVSSHADVAVLLGDPAVTDDKRFDLIVALAKTQLPAPVASLLRLVLENGRLPALPQVAAQFRALRNAAEGVCECLIESAFPMAEKDIAELVAALSRKFPLRLLPTVRVEPALIGGVRVTVGDQVLDQSVRARLDAMRATLTA